MQTLLPATNRNPARVATPEVTHAASSAAINGHPVSVRSDFARIAPDVKLGQRVRVFGFVNLYGCEVGDDVKIGTFVEIQRGAKIGNRCKISSHSFLCEGVTLEDEVFIGHNVTFINDLFPRATTEEGQIQTEA